MSHYATKSQVEKVSMYPIYMWYIQLSLKYSAVILKTVHCQLAIKVNTVDNNKLV